MSRRSNAATLVEPTPAGNPPPEPAPSALPARVSPILPRACEDVFGAPEPSKQAIRDRAYQIYLARNGAPGSSDSDWLAAERELREEAVRRRGLRMP